MTPYQFTAVINTFDCAGPQCHFNFPAVPVGKRLVLGSVSAQVQLGTRSVTLEKGSPFVYFVGVTSTAQGYVTVPVLLFYEANEVPAARISVPDMTQNTSLIVTLVGTLVPAN